MTLRGVLALALVALLAGCSTPGPRAGDAVEAASPFRAVDCAGAPPLPPPGEFPEPGRCYRDAATGAGVVALDARGARPEAASVSPFNSDGSRLLLFDNGASEWVLFDGATGARLRAANLTPGATEPRWSPLDRHSLYYVDGNRFLRYDARSHASTVMGEYANYSSLRSGGRADLALLDSGHIKLALLGSRANATAEDVLVLSVRERATFGRETVSSRSWALAEATRVDEVRMLPSDRVLVVADGALDVRHPVTGARVARLDAGVDVVDVCRTEEGRDVVLARRAAEAGGGLVAVDAATGASSDVLAPRAGEHLAASCRATHRAGAALVTAFVAPGAAESGDLAGRVLVARVGGDERAPATLVPHGTVLGAPARFLPVAVPDRDLSRALVLTNWGDPEARGGVLAVGVPPALRE